MKCMEISSDNWSQTLTMPLNEDSMKYLLEEIQPKEASRSGDVFTIKIVNRTQKQLDTLPDWNG